MLEDFCAALEKEGLNEDDGLATRITRATGAGPHPASSYQVGIWTSYVQRRPGSGVNPHLFYRLKGKVDVDALGRSLTEIVRRHDMLRTRLVVQEKETVQVVVPAMPVTVEVIPMSGVLKRTPELIEFVSRIIHVPLDEGTEPLLRLVLLRWSEWSHHLYYIFHPLLYDASVRRILLRELEVLYAAHKGGYQISLPEPALQYADFTVWQQKWLGSNTPMRRKLIDYWTRVLGRGELRVVQLLFPKTSPEPGKASDSFARCVFQRSVLSEVNRFAKEQGVTLFMFFVACVKVLLYQCTRQTDILVGTYLSSQSHSELEDVMGPRGNLVPLRTDLSGNPTFTDVLRRVREVVLEAQAHQDLPFERIFNALQDIGKPLPPIEAIIMHTLVEWPIFRLDGLRAGPSTLDTRGIVWGFSMNFINRVGRDGFLRLTSALDVTRYESEEARRFTRETVAMAETVIAHPSMTVDDLPVRA